MPERIGHDRLKRIIAAGGMGVVYEAVQEDPRRAVALKVMKQGVRVAVHAAAFRVRVTESSPGSVIPVSSGNSPP